MIINRLKGKGCRQLAKAVVCFLIIINSLVVPVYAKESGKCGDGVSWSLDNGVLTISGKGEMNNYYDGFWAPWYEYRNEIININIKNGITRIGDAAFYDCDNVSSVSIANSVTNIGKYAFYECDNLVSVSLSNKTAYIGDHGFKNCKSLVSITLPNSLISLGYEAFFGCESLVSITVPSSVYLMRECVFAYCKGLIQANIQANIGELPDWTFYGCESLVKVTLASTIINSGDSAFNRCDDLSIVNINTSEKNRNNLTQQIKEDVKSFGSVTGTTDSNETETSWKESTSSVNQKDAVENNNVTLGASISKGNNNQLDININTTIKNSNGYEEVIKKVNEYVDTQKVYGSETSVKLIVTIAPGEKVKGDLLKQLAGKNVELTIKGNVEIIISCKELDKNRDYKDFYIDYTIEKIDKPSNAIVKALGESEAYYLEFNDSFDFKVMIKVSFGNKNALNYGSIFQKNGGKWELKQSVQIDKEGYATFYFDGISQLKFVLGLNVKDVNSSNSIIPDSLSGDYGGLTDAYGNRYTITGRESKWGITIGELTIIMIAVVVMVVAIVGGVMYMMNKRKIELQKIYEEVMSKAYDPEKHKREYKFIKRKKKD